MKYQIENVERELCDDGSTKLLEVELYFEGNKGLGDFSALFTSEGHLYVQNSHFECCEQFKSKKGNGRLFSFSNALELTKADLPELEKMIEHWQQIRSNFIGVISCGASMIGWHGNNYIFPDGIDKYYKKDEIPDELKYDNRVLKDSLDNQFFSNGCEYLKDIPFRQHYKVGRFNFYLERNYFEVDDNKMVQKFEWNQPKAILELLKFMESNQSPLEELLKIT